MKYLLWPLSALYWLVTELRNLLYRFNLLNAYESSIYTIGVGNLTVGGAGKTPHVAYLLQQLGEVYQMATLSRGYGRQTHGFVVATPQATARTIGDEPLQLFRRFGAQVPVVVCEKRAKGLQIIERLFPESALVLLDDAFQHRAVQLHTNILLTDFGRLFYEDFLLPTGRLREARTGARRADAIVVSKCVLGLTEAQKNDIRRQIGQYTKPETPIFFSAIQYGTPQPYFTTQPPLNVAAPCVLVSGIAVPVVFEQAAQQYFNVIHQMAFGDHHDFSPKDLHTILQQAKGGAVLTTEKDFVKIKPLLADNQALRCCFYYWPIEVVFLPEKKTNFDEWLANRLIGAKP